MPTVYIFVLFVASGNPRAPRTRNFASRARAVRFAVSGDVGRFDVIGMKKVSAVGTRVWGEEEGEPDRKPTAKSGIRGEDSVEERR